jgi:hypothetical protein
MWSWIAGRWRAIVAGLCALILSPGPDAGAEAPVSVATAHVVSLEYEFTVAGLRAFRAEATLRLDGNRYMVDGRFSKEGIVAALSATFNGQNRVWGRTGPAGIRPLTGWSLIQFRDDVRTWQVTYRGDGTYGETHAPPFTPEPDRIVSAGQKMGAFDPLTAAVAGALTGAGPCDRVYAIFDSKRRFDVTLRRLGTEPLVTGELPGITGEAVVCEAVMKRIAGYNPERMRQDAYEREPPRLWFATIPGFERLLPVRMEMPTSFGTVHGRLTRHAVRPMAAEDRLATSVP